jgi:SAM-dependent methyltransferase
MGAALTGDVLEIGPGHAPFPTAPTARVTYADRKVAGGRDANFPELAGMPHGPQADVDVDLDRDGLGVFADGSFDAVVASHIIEHLANPIAALREIHRVLRPGGRVVLLVPDRDHTFDAGRDPTPLAHLLDEYRRSVTAVDDEHIREFCGAIFDGPVIHPPEVRDWHDPARLDAERMALHRRRTIHVHCWTPEEFAALLVGLVALGLTTWRLVDLYLREDLEDDPGIEFGLVLQRPDEGAGVAPSEQAVELVSSWTEAVLSRPNRDLGRLVLFERALRRDLPAADMSPDAATIPLAAAADEVTRLRAELSAKARDIGDAAARAAAAEARATSAEARATDAEAQLAAVLASRSHRLARTLAEGVSSARRVVGR